MLVAFRRRDLFATLPLLDRKNRQREYYLNRVIPRSSSTRAEGGRRDRRHRGCLGLNTRAGLAAVEAVVRERDERAAHGQRGDARRSARHLHRRRRRDRRRHRDLPEHVPRAGLAHRARMRDRPVGRDVGLDRRRRFGRLVLGARGRDRRQRTARSGRSPVCARERCSTTGRRSGTTSRSRPRRSAGARRRSTSPTSATPRSAPGRTSAPAR